VARRCLQAARSLAGDRTFRANKAFVTDNQLMSLSRNAYRGVTWECSRLPVRFEKDASRSSSQLSMVNSSYVPALTLDNMEKVFRHRSRSQLTTGSAPCFVLFMIIRIPKALERIAVASGSRAEISHHVWRGNIACSRRSTNDDLTRGRCGKSRVLTGINESHLSLTRRNCEVATR